MSVNFSDYNVLTSGSPPTRDKLRCEDKARARRDWRNERLRDIATALTDRSPESSLALPAEGLLHLKKVRLECLFFFLLLCSLIKILWRRVGFGSKTSTANGCVAGLYFVGLR